MPTPLDFHHLYCIPAKKNEHSNVKNYMRNYLSDSLKVECSLNSKIEIPTEKLVENARISRNDNIIMVHAPKI
jgi:hypothetical protein